ncbi:hypothetical protein LCGC14_3042370 [marine sediment metagenome]|uniref:Methyltransferase type 11 domain-containing protein n=1 Tax=marine sediment metagenome TaxID=412755 RepID=A0A0F8WPN5_9ZZZZ
MDKSLICISESFDVAIQKIREGRDWIENIPVQFRASQEFKRFEKEIKPEDLNSSNALDIRNFLDPGQEMNFLDAGCNANLMNYRLDMWDASYYGIDISSKSINAMRDFVLWDAVK